MEQKETKEQGEVNRTKNMKTDREQRKEGRTGTREQRERNRTKNMSTKEEAGQGTDREQDESKNTMETKD